MVRNPNFSGHTTRWFMIAQDYDVELKYVPGKANKVVDAISRYTPQRDSINVINQEAKSARSTAIKDKEGISARWEEHFSQLLNLPFAVNQTAIQQIPQKPTEADLNLPPTEEEVRTPIKQMTCGKRSFSILHCWEYPHPHPPQKLTGILESALPEAQWCFYPGCSTIDIVFMVHHIQKKCTEQQMDLYAVFIDLTKAFNTVNRDAIWSIRTELGCLPKFTTPMRLLNENMTGLVLCNGDVPNTFQITNGVKQGHVLMLVLFKLFFVQVLLHAVKDLNLDVYITSLSDGSVFNLRRLSAK
ncbi:uncharacterized protein [Macrobrachium rosenbergii]|uniref:uncharacterized protein n=1 Tax=Macrobrachium rosenbergii TaxID=79674 RepID=UPI0034D3D37C